VWAKHLDQTTDRLAVTVDKSIKEAREERRQAEIDRRRFDHKFEEFAKDAARDRKAMVTAFASMNTTLTKIEKNTSLWRNGGNGRGRNGGKRRKK